MCELAAGVHFCDPTNRYENAALDHNFCCDAASPRQRWNPPIQVLRELCGRELEPGVERPELGELRARLVESHLVDKFFECQRILREQIDAPFPVVETDRARD